MLDHNAFCIAQKRNSHVFLNVTAEKNVGKMYFVSEIIKIISIPIRCGETESGSAK